MEVPGGSVGIGEIGVASGVSGEAVEDPKVQELLDNQRIMLEKLDIIERKILQNPGIVYPGNLHRLILRYGFPMLVLLYKLNI